MNTGQTGLILLVAVLFATTLAAGRQLPDRLATMVEDVVLMELDSNVGRREVLESILSESGVAFERQTFSIEPRETYPRREGVNLIVTLGSGETDIVVGAHYDAAWLADGTLSRGAVDNAASSVILTRLAETLQAEPLRHRLHIVFFDMEEIGLVGSRHFAQMHEHAIAAAINLDVNGYGDHVFFGPTALDGSQSLHDVLMEVCVDEGIPCQGFGRFPSSDHMSFQRTGVPNVTVSVLPSTEVHQFWLLLNSDTRGVFAPGFLPRIYQTIHTANDSAALVEPEAMDLSFRTVLALIRSLDVRD